MRWAIGWALGCGLVVLGCLGLPAAAWIAIVVYHAGCLTMRRAPRPVSVGEMAPRRTRATTLVGIAALSALLVLAVGTIAARAWPVLFAPNAAWARWGLRPPLDFLWLAYYVTVNPWVEERFWRGVLLDPPAVALLGRRGAVLFSCLAFGGHHAAVLVASFGAGLGAAGALLVVLAGALWAACRLRTRSIAVGTASHMGADLGLALVYALHWRG